MAPAFFMSLLKRTAISLQSWTLPNKSILPVDMLSQSLFDKTIDVGKYYKD